MMKRALAAIGRFLDGAVLILHLFIRYTVIGVQYLVGLYYTLTLLARLSQDTTAITNSAFAIFATLSELSFGWARAADPASDLKARVAHAGERFLHAALSVLTASVLKYAALASGISAYTPSSNVAKAVASLAAGVAVSGLFVAALTFAHTGVVVLNRLLWERARQYPEYDSLT